MTREEIRSERDYAGDVGRSAGNSVGEMCNVLLHDDDSIEARRKRMNECKRVANHEITALQRIMRMCEHALSETANDAGQPPRTNDER